MLSAPIQCATRRFRDFHVVAQPPHIRSYCGTPIVLANGYRVGVLCALDTKPHAMCASSTRLMVNVAGLIAREIEGLAGSDYDLPLQPKVLQLPLLSELLLVTAHVAARHQIVLM